MMLNGVSGLCCRVLRCCVVAGWLPLHLVDVLFEVACSQILLSVLARAVIAALQVLNRRGGRRDGLQRLLRLLAGVFRVLCDDNSKN
jgi:hypothetical protein